MVIYHKEEDLHWHQLLDRGLEVALVAHADPGENHGESIGLSRAFDLAEKFGAIPVDHILSYELMLRYPEKFQAMIKIAGSNHTWFSTTLCIYSGDGKKDIRPKRDRHNQLLEFGFVEETSGSMDVIVTPSDNPHLYRVLGQTLRDFKEVSRDEIDSFLYVRVPEEHENRFNVIKYPHYKLKRESSKVLVEVDWEKVEEIPREQLAFRSKYNHVYNSSLLPDFLKDGFKETDTSFCNPTLGFFAPAESYGLNRRDGVERDTWNYWCISTRGEAVIIQRPL